MPFTLMFAFVLIGAAASIAMIVALLLPRGYLLHAGASLVFGAGIGVAVLSVGAYIIGRQSETQGPNTGPNLFLVASACGFVAVATYLALVWNRARERPAALPPAPLEAPAVPE